MSRTKRSKPGGGRFNMKHLNQDKVKKSGETPKNQLAKGRPPGAKPATKSFDSKKGRNKINQFHQLNKQLAAAEKRGDEAEVTSLKAQLEALGGIEEYQRASLQGQAADRGHDSSTVLLEWLQPITGMMKTRESKLRVLEVGALSTTNACSNADYFRTTRIDLNSQGEGILQQDFMDRPLPTSSEEKFDIMSLSLVLNFVPEDADRGEMLRRTTEFLDTSAAASFPEGLKSRFPAIFLVLPAPCITNSRFMDEERLGQIMSALGYKMLERKLSAKLIYSLWQLQATETVAKQSFPKEEVHPGQKRNNFCIRLA